MTGEDDISAIQKMVAIGNAAGVQSMTIGDLTVTFFPRQAQAPQEVPRTYSADEMTKLLTERRERAMDPLSDPDTHSGGLPSFRRYPSEEVG